MRDFPSPKSGTPPVENKLADVLADLGPEPECAKREVAESSGFSLHAGVWAKGGEREKLEHLARYVARK